MSKLQQITVKASQIQRAIHRAKKIHGMGPAEKLEIALIPSVARRLKQVNPRYENPHVSRVKGKLSRDLTRANNFAIGQRKGWAEYAGYLVSYNDTGFCWNGVRDDGYMHGPSCAWDGVRRELYHSFLDALASAYYHQVVGLTIGDRYLLDLKRYKITFVNDLG